MSMGLQLYDSAGNLTLSFTSRLFRYIGSVFVPAFSELSPQTVSWPGMAADGTWYVLSVEGTAFAVISTDQFTLYACAHDAIDSDYLVLRY